jgi:hypothetical protein
MYSIDKYGWVLSKPRCPKCSSCEKPIGVFLCVGCGKIFCSTDTVPHRKILRNQLHELIEQNKQLNKKMLSGSYAVNEICNKTKALKIENDFLVNKIDDWEQKSIDQIKKNAAIARDKLYHLYDHHTKLLETHMNFWQQHTKSFPELIPEMKEAMDDDGFHEGHLKVWSKMTDWKNKLYNIWTEQEIFQSDFAQLRETQLFISGITIVGDFPTYRPMPLPPDPQIPVYGLVPPAYSQTFTNQEKFHRGTHQFRIQTECMLFGIASTHVDLDRQSGVAPTTYGWSRDDTVYVAGDAKVDHSGAPSTMQIGDTFTMIVDCDDESITLVNETTKKTRKLTVDPKKCPLPWQLNVRFLDAEDN